MEPTTHSSLQLARVVASALVGGVVVFWIVLWVLTGGGQDVLGPEPLSPRLAFWIWAAVALSSFFAALVFRGRAVQPVGGSRRGARGDREVPNVARVYANLLIAWALLEGPALLAGVLLLLGSSPQILSTAAFLYGVGMVMTFPRAEWFRVG